MSSQRSNWREQLNASPSRMEQEIAFMLQDDQIPYLTQVEVPVTTADFYFAIGSRPLIVFVDGKVHLKVSQAMKDGELRTLLRNGDTEFSNCAMTAIRTRKEKSCTQNYRKVWEKRDELQ